MENNKKGITKSFFAAANGYGGFRSYFDTLFDPLKFSSVYILKGGPGTGKSSIMKKVLSEFESLCDDVEAIYCSSDPNSLDGLILEKDDKKVAIIDGTAPHSVDPKYPGANDTIINLGEYWDRKILKEKREFIEKINLSKSVAYRTAYKYLNIAGKITAVCDEIICSVYSKDSTEIEKFKNFTGNNSLKTRLITSYGKGGFGRIDTFTSLADSVFYVVGIYGSEYVFMKSLYSALQAIGCDMIISPCALDGDKLDGIFIESEKVAIIAGTPERSDGYEIIDTSKFIDVDRLKNERTRLEFLWRERESFLWSSADEFKKASDEHFSLEKIYTDAMNFDKLNDKYTELNNTIKKELFP